MENKIEYYQNIAYEEIQGKAERNEEYRKIDDMIAGEFELPEALRKLPWIGNRKFVSLAPRNAAQAATRVFSALLPSVNIDPLFPDEKEWERVEKMETAIEWHFKQLNQGRQKSVLWRVVESAVNYCNVSMQTEYLPYSRKGQTGKRIKSIKSKGDFNFIVHHPSTVYPRWSNDGLECVVLAQSRTLQDLIYQFGENNKGIKEYIEVLDSDEKTKGADYRTTEIVFYDYTDWEKRVIWFSEGTDILSGSQDTPYVIMDEKHGLRFIPWVVVDNEEPLLKATYDTWENANIIKTIVFSKHVQLAGHPSYWVKKLSAADNVDINTDNPSQNLELVTGQEAGVLPPPPLDPQLQKTESDLDSQIYQSSAASVLGSVERFAGANTPFSSINAVLQAAMAQLGLAKLTAEQALTEGFHQIFRWIDHSKEPLMAYRSSTKNRDRADMQAGAQIAIMPGEAPETVENENAIYFDPDELYITVDLKANTITDEQGRITNEINKVERLGSSKQSAYESLGGLNFEQEQEQRASELLFDAEIQMQIQKKQIDLELYKEQKSLEMQMMMQQQQMAQQQQMMPQDPNMATQDMRQAGAFAGAEGFDMRNGGMPPQQSAPGVGREQITGQDSQGTALA